MEALTRLMHEELRFIMPPQPGVWQGRDGVVGSWVEGGFGTEAFGSLRLTITRFNRQPAVANYVRKPGEREYVPLALDVLRIAEGRVIDIVTCDGSLFERLELPVRYGDGSGRAGTTTVPASMSRTPRRRSSTRIFRKPANSGSAARISPANLSSRGAGPDQVAVRRAAYVDLAGRPARARLAAPFRMGKQASGRSVAQLPVIVPCERLGAVPDALARHVKAVATVSAVSRPPRMERQRPRQSSSRVSGRGVSGRIDRPPSHRLTGVARFEVGRAARPARTRFKGARAGRPGC